MPKTHLDLTSDNGWSFRAQKRADKPTYLKRCLTLKHSRGRLVGAIMEGVTFSQRNCLAIIEELGLAVKQVRASGGGARSSFWRQMQADVLGKTVVSMVADEGTAYGVALLAAVGAGEFNNVAEVWDATIKTKAQTKPNAAARRCYDKASAVYQTALCRTAK